MVWGCMSSHGGGRLDIVSGTVKAMDYIQILQKKLLPTARDLLGNQSWIFQDNNALAIVQSNRTCLEYIFAPSLSQAKKPRLFIIFIGQDRLSDMSILLIETDKLEKLKSSSAVGIIVNAFVGGKIGIDDTENDMIILEILCGCRRLNRGSKDDVAKQLLSFSPRRCLKPLLTHTASEIFSVVNKVSNLKASIDIKEEQMMANVEFETVTTVVAGLKPVKVGLENLCSRNATLPTGEGVFSFVIG
ncbi:hypothetical protein TNCV_5142151 [Trichonephila clavipes]|nr:hypothetical protein TNCV_5142151 [Trichonephila clavipes]